MNRNTIKLFIFLFVSMTLPSPEVYAENPFSKFLGDVKKSMEASLQVPTAVTANEEQLRKSTLGVWEGTVSKSGATAYPVVIHLYDLTQGKTVGTVRYSSLACAGKLVLQTRNAEEAVFNETIETGKSKKCEEGATVKGKLTQSGSAVLEWSYPSTGHTAVAALEKKTAPSLEQPAEVTKGANMRTGPGTKYKVLGMVPKGTIVKLIAKEGSWYMLQYDMTGAPSGGWIHSSLISSNISATTQVAQAGSEATAATNNQTTTQDTPPADQTVIDYAGYSKAFRPVKVMLEEGKLDEVASFYDQDAEAEGGKTDKETVPIKMTGLLYNLEQGTLALDQGDYDKAVYEFSSAERLIDEQKNASIILGTAKKTGGWLLGTVLGNEEMFAYKGEGWEQVLMLNYKSIAYLLQGKRQAYNVTRRAIDWQNLQKKAFEKKLQEEKEKASKELDTEEKAEEDTAKEEVANEEAQKQDIKKGLAEAFAPMEAKATTIPSAYVNPFGFYVAGMIQEYESYNDRSLRDNARISYKKALELNPESKVLQQAVKDLEKPQAPAGTRLVHVVVADGFVPEKKVLTYNVQASNTVIPLKMPIYEPVKSKVHRIEVRSTTGKRLATLSPVADVEAICLRQQLDVQPLLTMRAMSSFVVTAATEGVAQQSQGISGILLKGISGIRKNASAPDTRSWMSLPATMQATRLHLRKGVNKLRIDTYDKKGKKLSSKTVGIDPNTHNFIYARSIDSMLYTQGTEKLWLAEM